MRTVVKHALILGVLVAFLATSVSVCFAEQSFQSEKETTAGFMVVDIALVRPAGICATILGTLAFVVALPFSAASGDTRYTYEKLMKEPAIYTFNRPVGFF